MDISHRKEKAGPSPKGLSGKQKMVFPRIAVEFYSAKILEKMKRRQCMLLPSSGH
jgi:hypothetical protein